VLLQWREEMEKDPYKYSFPVLEDNMRNASKVTLRECGGGVVLIIHIIIFLRTKSRS
jgi:hypothetical protein